MWRWWLNGYSESLCLWSGAFPHQSDWAGWHWYGHGQIQLPVQVVGLLSRAEHSSSPCRHHQRRGRRDNGWRGGGGVPPSQPVVPMARQSRSWSESQYPPVILLVSSFFGLVFLLIFAVLVSLAETLLFCCTTQASTPWYCFHPCAVAFPPHSRFLWGVVQCALASLLKEW